SRRPQEFRADLRPVLFHESLRNHPVPAPERHTPPVADVLPLPSRGRGDHCPLRRWGSRMHSGDRSLTRGWSCYLQSPESAPRPAWAYSLSLATQINSEDTSLAGLALECNPAA